MCNLHLHVALHTDKQQLARSEESQSTKCKFLTLGTPAELHRADNELHRADKDAKAVLVHTLPSIVWWLCSHIFFTPFSPSLHFKSMHESKHGYIHVVYASLFISPSLNTIAFTASTGRLLFKLLLICLVSSVCCRLSHT